MTFLRLSLAGLRGGRLAHALNVLVLALGLGTVTLMLLFSASLTNRLVRDGRGIDLVVGAKGSPLQLVLSAVYQADIPTGNIPLSEVDVLRANRIVALAVPIALGDAVHRFRIVGTTPDYLSLYGATLARGALWQAPLQAVLGADVARTLHLDVGDSFVGAHGISGDGELHTEFPYRVTGVLAPAGNVIDRLALTSMDSVWRIHEHEGGAGVPHDVTAVLLRARSPLAMVTLPHQINTQTPYQAAVPSIEAARLLALAGFGVQAFRVLADIIIASACLGMLAALVARLRERRRELAVLRLLGASRGQLFATVLIEALALAGAGALGGLLLGHGAAWAIGQSVPTGDALASLSAGLLAREWQIPALALAVGVAAALVPAIAAYRSDVSVALGGAD